MPERYIHAVNVDVPGVEEPAATRERLKSRFPVGAARRMTQLGMLIGEVLGELNPSAGDAVFYASGYGESRALEAFLESFPGASPTLFQTSVHPSAVQQGLIGRQRSVPELFPFAGAGTVVMQVLLAAMLTPSRRSLICGGEERGTWLRELGVASEHTYAFALSLDSDDKPEPVGRVALDASDETGPVLSLKSWFELLAQRRDYNGPVGPGWRLQLVWKTP
jgi:hypothetical protein